jgi:diketogulonate reductase-like aldo/keto reductase
VIALGESVAAPRGAAARRELGKTGVMLPAVGLGTWRYQGGVEPLKLGVALGASFIDTAESYGTEEVVGRAIEGVRQNVFLATKVAPRHFKYPEVINSANQSLKHLRTDYIDLYQLHWPNYTVPMEETMAAMESLAQSGKVRFIGVSNFMLGDLKRAQRAMRCHKITSNQVRYNVIDRTIENGLLKYCQEQGITVIAHSPLASNFASIRARDPENVVEKLAEAKSASAAQIALSWCLSKPGVVAIPKASSAEHVRENCAASDLQLSDSELEMLAKKLRFQRRNSLEIGLRRLARHALQMAGRNQ